MLASGLHSSKSTSNDRANRQDAEWIYQTGKELGLVHMAGSSVPQCFHRDPFFEHPIGSNIEDAVMLSYGGIEAYGCE